MLLEVEVAVFGVGILLAIHYVYEHISAELARILVQQHQHISKDDFEIAVERSNRRVLQAHEARINPPRDGTPIAILYKDSDLKTIIGQEVIPLWKRKPKMSYGGKLFMASSCEGNVWVYKEDK